MAFIAAVSTLGYGRYREAITELESTNDELASAESKKNIESAKRLLCDALASGSKLIGTPPGKTDEQFEQDPKCGDVEPTA
jgi:hypothetical protein